MQAKELWRLFEGKQNNVQSLEPGSAFPFGAVPAVNIERRQTRYVLFLSMYCSICMELLPELIRISPEIGKRFVLGITGTPEEIQEIRNHFGFDFPVISLRAKEMEGVYRVYATPFLYAISAEGIILSKGTADVYEDFITFVNAMEG